MHSSGGRCAAVASGRCTAAFRRGIVQRRYSTDAPRQQQLSPDLVVDFGPAVPILPDPGILRAIGVGDTYLHA
jgi:hypothetical protein